MFGGALPGLAVLGSVRKQDEQAMMSRAVCSSRLRPLHQVPALLPFLCLLPSLMDCSAEAQAK